MRTAAALLLALPLVASAQTSPPTDTWVNEPAASPAAPPAEPAPPPAPAAAQPTPPPAPPAYPPPPQAAPPAQPQPQPMPAAPPPGAGRPKTRDRWYLGFGVGGGNGNVRTDAAKYTFREVNGDRGTDTTFFNLKIGGTLSPKLLLGGDASGTVSSADSGGVKTELVIANVDAVVTWFPYEKGFFLRGGAGISSISYTYEDPAGKQEGTNDGFNVLAGAGYAFWLGSQFNLTLNLDLSRQWYGTSANLRITDAQYWALWVGFDWY